jgi:hypothetical protein
MTDDPWGFDGPPADAGTLAKIGVSEADLADMSPEEYGATAQAFVAAEIEELLDPEQCANCGRLPLHRDGRASAMLLSRIRGDLRERLSRTEQVLSEIHEADRIAVARWLQETLDRPPLRDARSRSYEPIVAVLDALWRDIYWSTSDPASPVVDGWTVPIPHQDLVEMREGEFVQP